MILSLNFHIINKSVEEKSNINSNPRKPIIENLVLGEFLDNKFSDKSVGNGKRIEL